MMWAIVTFYGINWASLPYTSLQALELFTLATVLWVGLMLALNGVERLSMRYGSRNSLTTLVDLRTRNARLRRLASSWTPRLAMLVVGYILGQAQLLSPIREAHNVEVLGKVTDRVYTMKFPDAAQPMTIRLCYSGDDLPLSAGMVIEPFQYIQEKGCLLINERTYVDWKRDERKNVVDKQGKVLFAESKEE